MGSSGVFKLRSLGEESDEIQSGAGECMPIGLTWVPDRRSGLSPAQSGFLYRVTPGLLQAQALLCASLANTLAYSL